VTLIIPDGDKKPDIEKIRSQTEPLSRDKVPEFWIEATKRVAAKEGGPDGKA
jgi:hypothetical protein